MESKIRKALDEIRPAIQADGGDVELVSVDQKNGVVTVRLQGACAGCALSSVTLKAGIERTLRERVPGVKRVDAT